ncbi:hypothetical protein NDU88_002297 [Pleurodeles waltl]|uniref:Uncharacterized protein n=1 Tax=Pleurodeles waltl TaxID=8319 RepID=A0AAV7MP78_PLEWA|nr:hypothetical protein NDU88_002297 [Pleurodeles waltl]
MYRPPYHNSPICHLFQGGSPADKNTAETDYERENAHLYTLHEESGQHGTRIKHPTSYCLPAHLPRVRTPAQTTAEGPSGAELETAVPSGAVLETAVPAQRCLSWRGPVQRCLRRRSLFSGACHGGPCSAVLLTAGPCSCSAVLVTAAPVQRCLSRRGPVQRCFSRRPLFSGACHGGPCSAVLGLARPCSAVLGLAGPCSAVLLTAAPVQRCFSRRPLFSGACHGGPCSAVLGLAGPCSAVLGLAGPCSAVLLTAAPVQRCFSRWGPVQRCLSWRGPVQQCFSQWPLFSGACPVFLGNQTCPILPAQSPSDLSVAGPSCDGVLGPWVSSVTPGMGLVGPSWSARLLPDLSALLPLPSFAEALWPLPPFVDVAGDRARLLSLVAAVSGLSRRPFIFLVLFPGGGLAVPLLLADVPALGAGGLQ